MPDERAVFTINVADLLGPDQPMMPASMIAGTVMTQLEQRVEAAGMAPHQLGKLITSNGNATAGLYLDRGMTSGALVTYHSVDYAASSFTLTVGPSSKVSRAVVWVSLGGGVLAGLLFANWGLAGYDAQLRLALGLLGGAGIAVPVIMGLTKTNVLVNDESTELSTRLVALVRRWVDERAPEAP